MGAELRRDGSGRERNG